MGLPQRGVIAAGHRTRPTTPLDRNLSEPTQQRGGAKWPRPVVVSDWLNYRRLRQRHVIGRNYHRLGFEAGQELVDLGFEPTFFDRIPVRLHRVMGCGSGAEIR